MATRRQHLAPKVASLLPGYVTADVSALNLKLL